MKIPDKLRELQGEVVSIDSKDRALKNNINNQPQTIVDALAKEKGDRTQISDLGAALSQQSNQILDERQAKIASIKKQIENGTYNPPLTEVAQSLADEITDEILYTGGLGSTSNS